MTTYDFTAPLWRWADEGTDTGSWHFVTVSAEPMQSALAQMGS